MASEEAAFDWEGRRTDLEASLKQQRALMGFFEGGSVVVKTSVLEERLDDWPSGGERGAQLQHSASIWLSDSGMSLSRVSPLPGD